MPLTIYKKALFLGLLILLSSLGNLSNVSGDEPVLDRQILYVGELGEYSYIQDAIDNASNWDTVFVYNGTYYENVVIDKSIELIGENRDITKIDGNEMGHVVLIEADLVTISNFTIQHSGNNTYNSGDLSCQL